MMVGRCWENIGLSRYSTTAPHESGALLLCEIMANKKPRIAGLPQSKPLTIKPYPMKIQD